MDNQEIKDYLSTVIDFLITNEQFGDNWNSELDALTEAIHKIDKLDKIESDPWRAFISNEIPYQIDSYRDAGFEDFIFEELNEEQQQSVIDDLVNYYTNNSDFVIDYDSFLSDLAAEANSISKEILNEESDLDSEAQDMSAAKDIQDIPPGKSQERNER